MGVLEQGRRASSLSIWQYIPEFPQSSIDSYTLRNNCKCSASAKASSDKIIIYIWNCLFKQKVKKNSKYICCTGWPLQDEEEENDKWRSIKTN